MAKGTNILGRKKIPLQKLQRAKKHTRYPVDSSSYLLSWLAAFMKESEKAVESAGPKARGPSVRLERCGGSSRPLEALGSGMLWAAPQDCIGCIVLKATSALGG